MKKYLSLEEAAKQLSMPQEELRRLREQGEVRGFADRGTWKFKLDDIEQLARKRQADSNPEVPLFDETATSEEPPAADVGEQPTVIRKDRGPEPSDSAVLSDEPDSAEPDSTIDSDSDVRLVGGKEMDLGYDSDSDVKLVGLDPEVTDSVGTDPEIPIMPPDSDSDVKLIRPDSDSDVKLSASDSDSDVQLVGGTTDDNIPLVDENTTDSGLALDEPVMSTDSDSNVRLMPEEPTPSSDDVSLLDDDDAVALDLDSASGSNASVLDDESGVTLGGDSSLLLGESGINLSGPSDSGIALDGNDDDEGITLALDDDSGISLDGGDSGISLESADSGISLETGESGISLEGPAESGTIPMMDIVPDEGGPETQFEIPSLEDDSAFDLHAGDDTTGVLDLEEDVVDDATFDVDEDEVVDADQFDEDADLEFEGDDFEADDDLDVFEAEDAFEGAEAEGYAGAGVGRLPMAEQEWGTFTFVGLTVASLALLLCGAVMIDLVKNTATAAQPNPVSGMVIDMLGGLYKG